MADVERATQTMRTFIPRPPDRLRPGAPRHQTLLSSLFQDLDQAKTNMSRPDSTPLSQVEALFRKIM